MRTNLDGTDSRVVLQNMDNPNGLALHSGGELYVVDSHDKTNKGNANYPRAKRYGALYSSLNDGQQLNELSNITLKVSLALYLPRIFIHYHFYYNWFKCYNNILFSLIRPTLYVCDLHHLFRRLLVNKTS